MGAVVEGAGSVTLKLGLFQAGYCTHPEWITLRGGRMSAVPFPALFALIEHPDRGAMLVDTGYAPRFYQQTRRFPYSLYARITPAYIQEGQTAARQLQRAGISADSIRAIFITHFHADHIAGVQDFPKATLIFFQQAYDAVKGKRGVGAVKAGFLAGLLPQDFATRARPLDAACAVPLPRELLPFERGVDVWGDQSLWALHLPGHAHGQMGLYLNCQRGPVLLASDACWHSRAYRELIAPHWLSNLALADPRAYRRTLQRLHQLHQRNPSLEIVPFHCAQALERFSRPLAPAPGGGHAGSLDA